MNYILNICLLTITFGWRELLVIAAIILLVYFIFKLGIGGDFDDFDDFDFGD